MRELATSPNGELARRLSFIIIVVVVVVVDDDTYYWVYLSPDHPFQVYSKYDKRYFTKCDSLFYYKGRWSVITKCDSFFLLQSATSVITKGESYYKVRQNRRFKNRLEQNKKCIGYHRQVY